MKTIRSLSTCARVAAVLLPLAFGACREADLTGPESPESNAPICSTTDCVRFRALTPTTIAPLLATASQIATTSLSDAGLGQRLASRISTLQNEIDSAGETSAKIAMLAVLLDIDNAMADPARRADLADLSSMRLDLEPVVIFLGLR